MRILYCHATAIVLAAFPLQIAAQGAISTRWPVKPVRIVIGFTRGVGSDLVTRFVTPGLTKAVGQQFIVDNRPGATGNIAAELAARAPADGHTLLTATSTLAVNHSMYQKAAGQPAEGF